MCYFDYDYDAASRTVSITRENGCIIYCGYDDADRLTSEEWRSSDNSLIYAFAWDYDPVGNRTYQSQVGFNGGTSVAPAQTYYDYDPANQLTRSRQINGDSPGWTYYEYDSRASSADTKLVSLLPHVKMLRPCHVQNRQSRRTRRAPPRHPARQPTHGRHLHELKR